jgi:hypothetical protein
MRPSAASRRHTGRMGERWTLPGFRRCLPLAVLLLLAVLAPDSRADWRTAPAVPHLDAGAKKRLLGTLRWGRALGNRAAVFAKVGDSLSASPAFMQALGCPRWRRSGHPELDLAVKRFRATALPGGSADCGRVNSFSRNSSAARPLMPSPWANYPGGSLDAKCQPDETPLRCEVRLIRPAYAVILMGTNDASVAIQYDVDVRQGFIAAMSETVTTARALGVVPVLTTIPPRTDSATAESVTEGLNEALSGLAAARHVPLINLWRAVDPLPGYGISTDGIHLSLFGGSVCTGICDPASCAPACQPADFSRRGLRYGYNMRNLITMKTLSRLSRIAREHLRRRHPGA